MCDVRLMVVENNNMADIMVRTTSICVINKSISRIDRPISETIYLIFFI